MLDRAAAALQEDAVAIRLVLQGQSAAVGSKAHVLLNKIELAQAMKRRQARDFLVAKPNLAWPTAARAATLTFVNDPGHWPFP